MLTFTIEVAESAIAGGNSGPIFVAKCQYWDSDKVKNNFVEYGMGKTQEIAAQKSLKDAMVRIKK